MLFKIRMEGYSNLSFCFLCLNGVCLLIKERFEGSRRNKGVRFRSGIWQLRVQDSNVKLLIDFNWLDFGDALRACLPVLATSPLAVAVVRPTRFDLPQATNRTPSVRRVQLEGRLRYHTCVSYCVATLCKRK